MVCVMTVFVLLLSVAAINGECHCRHQSDCEGFPFTPCSAKHTADNCETGWFGPYCQKLCNDGWFGDECDKQCHCQNKLEVCDKISGICRSGCAAGFEGASCQNACLDGYHGSYCNLRCGSCKHNSLCDKVTGHCLNGCQRNFKEPFCNACLDGYYGSYCNLRCGSCKHNSLCDKVTGRCLNGCQRNFKEPFCNACLDGYYGSYCNLRCGSCKHNSLCDKVTGHCLNGCQGNFKEPFCNACLDGYHGSYCNLRCGSCKHNSLCDKVTGHCLNGCQRNFKEPFCNACLDGYHGSYCNLRCGSCKHNSLCDKVTGHCLNGCQRNFKEPFCNACLDGYYGSYCNLRCGSCKHNSLCDKVTGHCLNGCQRNFKEPFCNVCSDGWFDDECDKQCQCQSKGDVCDKNFGTCVSGCAAGFNGDNCQTQCVDGIFGPNCNETCGMCEGGFPCNKTTGRCPRGCVSGYIQDDVLCRTECVDGIFGPNCNETCGMCEGGFPCNKTTGRCPRGCVSGYIQDDVLCRTVSPEATVQNGILAAAGGGASAVLVVIIILVVAVVVFTKRRQRENGENNTMEKATDHLQLNAINTGNTPPLFDEDEDALFRVENDLYVSGEDMSTYYNWVPPHMTLDKLQHCVMDKKIRSTLETQLKVIPYGLRRPHDVGRKPKNKVKNRFAALYPYDHSRVVLEGVGDGYINANYITGFDDTPRYIATQGPTKMTFGDFWSMIWQERVTTVIMLTQFVEHKKKKCDKYWPEKTETKQYGRFTVTNKEMTVRADYTISKLVIHCPDSEERTVSHFHYTQWPDHGVPSAPALIAFWKKVKQHGKKTGPLVVHCSAGVGRTGTFIALDYLVDEYESEHKVNVFMCVTRMREARMNMVQTLGQYQFVHDAVLEAIYTRDTKYTCTDLKTLFGAEGINPDQLDSKLKPQFRLLQNLRKPFLDMNGDQDIIYENNAQVRRERTCALAGKGTISSTILSSVVRSSMLLVTRTPFPDTMVDFWTLVTDYDCSTIVSLDVTKELRELYPDANKHIEYGSVTIKHIEEKDTPVYMKTRLVLTSKNQGSDRYVTVFWLKSSDTMSRNTSSLLTIVKRVDEEICSTGHNVLVHCPDGYHDCGIFCAALNVIGQLRLDSEVDIFLTIRKLQWVQPHFIMTYGSDRYVTVFWLKSSDTMSRNTSSLLTIVKRVDEEICSTGHNVLVHCPDGYHDCGIFCAALNVIGQLRLDSEVDIFLTIRKLQWVQPHFIMTYEQYKLCYDFVREFVCSANAAMP